MIDIELGCGDIPKNAADDPLPNNFICFKATAEPEPPSVLTRCQCGRQYKKLCDEHTLCPDCIKSITPPDSAPERKKDPQTPDPSIVNFIDRLENEIKTLRHVMTKDKAALMLQISTLIKGNVELKTQNEILKTELKGLKTELRLKKFYVGKLNRRIKRLLCCVDSLVKEMR